LRKVIIDPHQALEIHLNPELLQDFSLRCFLQRFSGLDVSLRKDPLSIVRFFLFPDEQHILSFQYGDRYQDPDSFVEAFPSQRVDSLVLC